MFGNSCVAAQLAASQEGLISMALVNILNQATTASIHNLVDAKQLIATFGLSCIIIAVGKCR
jgi:hypothetical protein